MIEIMNWGNEKDRNVSDCTDVVCVNNQAVLLDFITTKGMKAPHEAGSNDS